MTEKNKDKNQKPKKFEIHLITLGYGEVGKTSLIVRYTDNKFNPIYIQTVGFDNKFKTIQLEDGNQIKVVVYDTAGQERYHSIAGNYSKKADGILLVYNITSEKSFESVKIWAKQMIDDYKDSKPMILIGNKSDLEDERVINKEQGEEFAKSCLGGIKFYETSCKTGDNINIALDDLVKQVYKKKYGNQSLDKNNTIKIKKNNKNFSKKKCC